MLATVSTAEKAKLARGAGAAEVLRSDEVDDLAAAVRDLTGGDGVAVAFDGVGRDTFDASLASLRRRGTLVLYGAASGPVPPVDPQRLNRAGSVYLTRPTLHHYVATRARAARPRGRRVRRGRRRQPARAGSGTATRSTAPRTPTPTWRAAGPPARCC